MNSAAEAEPPVAPAREAWSQAETKHQGGLSAALLDMFRQWPKVGLLAAVSFGLLLWVAHIGGMTIAAVLTAVKSVPTWAYLPVALVQSAIILLGALKWRLVLKATGGHHVSQQDATSATALGTLLGQVLPIQVVTPAVRAWIARRRAISPGQAVGASLVEQATEALVLGAMALIGCAVFLGDAVPFVWAALASAMTALLVWVSSRRRILRSAGDLLPAAGDADGLLGQALSKMPHFLSALSGLSGILILRLMGIGLARYVLLAALNVTILMWLAPGADPVTLIAAFPLVLFFTSLPFLPGGLGIVEMTWLGVLVAQGESSPTAAEAAIVLRIVSTLGFLLAAPLLIAWRDSSGRSFP